VSKTLSWRLENAVAVAEPSISFLHWLNIYERAILDIMFKTYESAVDGDFDALERVRDVVIGHAGKGFYGTVAIVSHVSYVRLAACDESLAADCYDMAGRAFAAAKNSSGFAYCFAVTSKPGKKRDTQQDQLIHGALLSLSGVPAVVHNVCAVITCNVENGKWESGSPSPVSSKHFLGPSALADFAGVATMLADRASEQSLDDTYAPSSVPPAMRVKAAPSRIAYGVGLFPLQLIPKGETVLHFHWRDHEHTVPIHMFPEAQRDYLRSIWSDAVPDGLYFHPVNFLNHTALSPAVYYDDDLGDYIATRDLTPDDEITIDYRGYNEPRLSEFAEMLTGAEKEATESDPSWRNWAEK